MRTSPVRLGALVVVVAIAAGCRDRAPGGGGARPVVAVTIFPVADLTRAIAGPAADVVTVLPPGASPHTFDPSPAQARRLAPARLVVAIGGGLDGWAAGLAGAGARRIALTDGLALIDGNPHVWLDPVVVRDRVVPRLTDALVALAPAEADAVRARAARVTDELTALDAAIRTELGPLTSRGFVASHPAWTYFAARYDLDEVGVVYRAGGREPSPRELAALVNRARRAGVRVVFTEPQLGELGVRALADELGATVATLNPLGGVAGADSYEALLRHDAGVVAAALGGRR